MLSTQKEKKKKKKSSFIKHLKMIQTINRVSHKIYEYIPKL